jgi:hypothetical protein
MSETFYLIEKIASPSHYSNFAKLISSVCRGITISSFIVKIDPKSFGLLVSVM